MRWLRGYWTGALEMRCSRPSVNCWKRTPEVQCSESALCLCWTLTDGTRGEAAGDLEGAVAVLAAELGLAVREGVGEGLQLPERLGASAVGSDAAAFYLTLVEFFNGDDFFGGHGAFLGAVSLA